MNESNVRAFPLRYRRNLVSGVASVLAVKQGQDGVLFWRETAKDLLQQLLSAGVSRKAAADEVRSLLQAALTEMQQRAAAGARQG